MDTADDSRLLLTWHLRLPFWAWLSWRGLPEPAVSVVYQGSMIWVAIVVQSLPGDTPEDIEHMIAQATNGDATAEILHINRVAV